jgi:hypothetical protein
MSNGPSIWLQGLNRRFATAREVALGKADRDGYLLPPNSEVLDGHDKRSLGQSAEGTPRSQIKDSKHLVRYH